MRRIVIACLLCFISCTASGQQVGDLSDAYSRLHQFCGYKLDRFVARRVASANVEENEISVTIRFHLHINGQRRGVPATLDFGCRKQSFPDSTSDGFAATPDSHKMTAKEVIASEDSGGRYFRIVSWQRKYHASGFGGTVAYVNKIFGDGEVMSTSGLFFACPNTVGLTCYSVEVAPNFQLTRAQQMDVLNIIKSIDSVSDSR
ncbi:hypothetical protein [Cupriavidus necator]|uniref:hypothetical protein n=1 Tax=Cupriavidus necator TaxID=106590 RepID=UPI000F4F8C57|nr:hypothetical protein [Cupriavidus necator]